MAFWTTAGKARSREIKWTVSSPKNSTVHSWRPSREDARDWMWMQDLRIRCVCNYRRTSRPLCEVRTTRATPDDLKEPWRRHNFCLLAFFLQWKCILHTPCLCLQVRGHAGVLGFSAGFSAGSLCEIRQQLPLRSGMIWFFEFWTRGLALSWEKQKTPFQHMYTVYALWMCAYSEVCLEIFGINSGGREILSLSLKRWSYLCPVSVSQVSYFKIKTCKTGKQEHLG